MIPLYILDILFLFSVGALIWNVLPDDFTEEIGAFVGTVVEFVWVVFWIIYFPVMGHHITITQ